VSSGDLRRDASIDHQTRATALLVGLAAWLVYITSAGGTLGTSDAVAMFAQADAIVTRGAMDVSLENSSEAWRGVNGRFYLPFGPAQPVFDIPFLLAGRAAAALVGTSLGDPDVLPKAAVAMNRSVPAAVSVALGFLLAWQLSRDRRASLVAAIALAFGTLVWPYATFGSNAALATAALTGGVYGIGVGGLTARRGLLAAGGVSLGIAWLTRHEMALAAVPAMAWLAWQTRRHPGRIGLMAAAFAGIAIAAGIWMTLNALHFSHPFSTGHHPDVTFRGAAAFLMSPSGALLLYSPVAMAGGALIPTLRQGEALAWLLASVTVVLMVFYASLDDWLGTRSYGPRYLVPLLPLLVAPLALWWRRARRGWPRAPLIALIGLSVLVQTPAIVVDFSQAGIAAEQPAQKLRRDDWAWAPVWLNLRHAARAVPANVRYLTGQEPRPILPPDAGSLSDRLSFSLNFWWLYLYYLGMLPGWAAAAAALVPLSIAAVLGRAAYRRTATMPAPWPASAAGRTEQM
jgi:hypothetical protein